MFSSIDWNYFVGILIKKFSFSLYLNTVYTPVYDSLSVLCSTRILCIDLVALVLLISLIFKLRFKILPY